MDNNSNEKIIEKTYENGEKYIGSFKNGKREGKGKIIYKNGDMYEGEWNNDLKNGKGKATYANGTTYEGEWKNGAAEGKGKLLDIEGSHYEGEWKNDKREGKGKNTWVDGSYYEGDWVNNERHGKGKYVYSNGDIYIGEWKNNKKNGKGKEEFSNGGYYEGEWKNDKMNGKGKLITHDLCYEGEFKDNKVNGQGKCILANGRIYEGEWKNNQLHGRVKMTLADESCIEGDWKITELSDIDENDYTDDLRNKKNEEEMMNMPGIPLTAKEREIKLLEYMDMEISNREEEIYNKKEDSSYFARMDTDIDYKEGKYYQKFYISKDIIKEKEERGVVDIYGNYITPSELRDMRKSGLITTEEVERGVYKEYEDGTILIHWTAPLANLYYDKENFSININDYKYNTMLKRTFSFNPFKFYNSYIAENEFYKDGTVDEFLIKVLLDKKESNRLSDIIYTIQENQNKIIRADVTKSFIVQGCAGSGKTMILLHRLSYLKFNNKLPNYDKIKIITPNHLFSDFIKNLTKDLYVEEIEQMSISDYYLLLNKSYLNRYNKIEQIDNKFYTKQKSKFNNQFSVENMLDEHSVLNNKIFAIYSSKLFSIIEEEYNQIIEAVNKKIVKNDLDIDEKYSDNKTYYEQIIKNMDLKIKKLQKIVDDNRLRIFDIKNQIDNMDKLRVTLEEKKNRISKEIQTNYKECEDLRKKKEIRLNRGKIFFKEIRNNLTMKQYDEVIELKMKDINILKESEIEIEEEIKKNKLKDNNAKYQLEKYQNDNIILNDKISKYNDVKNEILEKAYFTIDIYDTIQSKIREKYNIVINKNQYLKIDLIILLYINYIHIGKIINGDILLCIDEAQDYSSIEYEVLNIVNKNIVMNLYGDINQSIYIEGIDNWEDLKNRLKCDYYILKENYRNSSEITKYCNEKFNYDILEMGLAIKNVEIIRKDKIDEIINQKIKDKKSIVVISKEDIKERINNELVSYCDVKSAKGIEYNTVIVNDKGMSENEKYISYTRALSELYILANEE